jgi:hypothetical protein
MPSGGPRAGAGRPNKTELHEKPIARAEKKFADKLPQIADKVLELAAGGPPLFTKHWQAAGTLFVEGFEIEQLGEGRTRVVKVKKPMYPDKQPDELVLIKQTETPQPGQLQANIYALDRIMGRPVEKVEQSGPDGGSIPLSFEAALEKAYGEEPKPEDAPTDAPEKPE